MPYHVYASKEHHNPQLFLSRYRNFLTQALNDPTKWVHTDACLSISIAKKRAAQQKYFVRCLRAVPREFPDLSKRLEDWGIETWKRPFTPTERAKMGEVAGGNVPMWEVVIRAVPRKLTDEILDDVLGNPD